MQNKSLTTLTLAISLAVLGLLPACGGGSGADTAEGTLPPEPPPATDTNAPELSVLYPPNLAHTTATAITIRGQVRDDVALALVTMNGETIVTSEDFSLSVSLRPGTNRFSFVATDTSGNVTEQTVLVRSGQTALQMPVAVGAEATGSWLVADAATCSLIRLEPIEGLQTISSPSLGTGPHFVQPVSVVEDTSNDRYLVLDDGLKALFAVDRTSGDRTILSDSATGDGFAFRRPTDLTLNSASNRALVTDAHMDRVIAVDLATGERTLLSGDTQGDGVALSTPVGIAYDATAGRTLVVNARSRSLLFVDGTDGDRLPFSGADGDLGGLAIPSDVKLFDADTIYLCDEWDGGRIRSVDLTSGTLSDVSSEETGDGPPLRSPTRLAVSADGAALLVLDSSRRSIFEIDVATGDRAQVATDFIGEGPSLDTPSGIAVDAVRSRVIVATTEGLFSVDNATGNRVRFASNCVSASRWVLMHGDQVVAFDDTTSRLVVVNAATGECTSTWDVLGALATPVAACPIPQTDAILVASAAGVVGTIELATGLATVLPSSGPAIGNPTGIAVTSDGSTAFVSDATAGVIRLDIASGTRTALSGTGVPLTEPTGLAIGGGGESLFVLDSAHSQVVLIDIASGARSLLVDTGADAASGFERASAIDLSPAGLGYVTDADSGEVFVVDLVTGAQVVMSR